jgi:hypothetical protein
MLLLLVVDERNTSEKWVAPTQLSVAYVIVILQVSPKHRNRGVCEPFLSLLPTL